MQPVDVCMTNGQENQTETVVMTSMRDVRDDEVDKAFLETAP